MNKETKCRRCGADAMVVIPKECVYMGGVRHKHIWSAFDALVAEVVNAYTPHGIDCDKCDSDIRSAMLGVYHLAIKENCGGMVGGETPKVLKNDEI